MVNPNDQFDLLLAQFETQQRLIGALQQQIEEGELDQANRLKLAAMELVNSQAENPLTKRPHSWTSGLEAVKMGTEYDRMTRDLIALRAEQSQAWATAKTLDHALRYQAATIGRDRRDYADMLASVDRDAEKAGL